MPKIKYTCQPTFTAADFQGPNTDVEVDALCVLDGKGVRVPLTRVRTATTYDAAGIQLGQSTTIESYYPVIGEWLPYTLGAGEVVGECPKAQTTSLIEGCFIDKDGDTIVGYAMVDSLTGSLVAGPLSKGDLGFVACCDAVPAGRMCFYGFESSMGHLVPGGLKNWGIIDENGVEIATTAVDLLANYDGVNPSTMYPDMISWFNSSAPAGWSLSVDPTAVSPEQKIKPKFTIDYDGLGGVTNIAIRAYHTNPINPTGYDLYTFTVDSSGNITVDFWDNQLGTAPPYNITAVC